MVRHMPASAFLKSAAGAVGVLLVGLSLAGCAGGGSGDLTTQALTPDQTALAARVPADKARLTLTRPSGLLYAGAAATVKVNGAKVADLYPGSTQSIDVSPGKASITVEAWSYPGSWTDEVALIGGVTYEVEVAARQDGVGTAVLFGAIGGAVEAQGNPKSGLFEWKVLKQSAPVVAAAPASAVKSAAPAGKSKQAAGPKKVQPKTE